MGGGFIESESETTTRLQTATNAVQALGRGFDVNYDIRLLYCKGGSAGSRLVEVDERNFRDLVLYDGVVVSDVSRDIRSYHDVTRRETSGICDYSEMVDYFNNKAGVSETFPLGSINSAFGLSGSRESDADTTKTLVKDGVVIPLAKVQLTNCPLVLSDRVKRALPKTWDPPALASFIENFGTHIVTSVTIGGKDAIYVKQHRLSPLTAMEIKNYVQDMGDKRFSSAEVPKISALVKYNEKNHYLPIRQGVHPQPAAEVHLAGKEDITVMFRRRGGDDFEQSHAQWVKTVQSAPDVIEMTFFPIASLLEGVPGKEHLVKAIGLYLEYKPQLEELRYFLEFQTPKVWAPLQDSLPGHLRKEPVCQSLQFSLMGQKLYVCPDQVSVGRKPVTGLRLCLEGMKLNRLSIHVQHLVSLPKILRPYWDTHLAIGAPKWLGPEEQDSRWFEPVKWKNFSHVSTAPIENNISIISDVSGVHIVTGAQLGVWDFGSRNVLYLKLLFSKLPGCTIRRSVWDNSPSNKKSSTEFDPSSSDYRFLKAIDTTEMTKGPENAPGHWLVTGAKLEVEKGTISLRVKYSLLPKDKVTRAWIEGNPCRNLFAFQTKLKRMKLMMKKEFVGMTRGMEGRVAGTREKLFQCQERLEKRPDVEELISEEKNLLEEFRKVLYYQYLFYKQRAKIHWMKEGDSNSKFFHSVIKGRRAKNKIQFITDSNGITHCDNTKIKETILNHFKGILGVEGSSSGVKEGIVQLGATVNEIQSRNLMTEITDKEIWDVLQKMASDKAPGPDGFSVGFFKENWETLGTELCVSIKNAFRYNALPKGLNSAIITLIPKSENQHTPSDFRPISCCNVVYKVFSGILANRLKQVLSSIINPAQGAFVEKRSIVGNISLAQQLLCGYERKNISQRCAWKIDLKKAYDTVNWEFLENLLIALKVPFKFISWVLLCVKTATYSISINGESVGYFEGKRGLRQGDPLSPLLFTLVMEYLSRILKKMEASKEFFYHPKCHRAKITHLMFADDLFVFSSGRDSAMKEVVKAVKEFLMSSGLSINEDKSQVFVAGMDAQRRLGVMDIFGSTISTLPIRYLGVPLTSRSLRAHECTELSNRIIDRLKSWNNNFLSRAGRLVLINSVLQAAVLYWARVFHLPKKVIKTVNRFCANFLWKGRWDARGGHLVKWEEVCMEKKKGGLGVKNLKIMNDALVMQQLWNVSEGSSLWSAWLKEYWMKGRNWWEEDLGVSNSWVTRRLSRAMALSNSCVRVEEGVLKWIGRGSGFSVKDSYQTLAGENGEIEWWKVVWNKLNTPKDCIHAWLVAKGRLYTKERLGEMGLGISTTCPLCEEVPESVDHLFLQCKVAKEVWDRVLAILKCYNVPASWQIFKVWFNRLCSTRLKTHVIAAAMTKTMWQVWKARNGVVFRNEDVNIDSIVGQICRNILLRIGSVKPTSVCNRDRIWLESIQIRL